MTRIFFSMQCKMMKREICKCKIHVTFGDSFPQAGLLTGCRVIPMVPVESLSLFMLLPQHLHGGFVVCLLLRVVSCGVFNMLGESSLGLQHPFIDVADSDVEVINPLSEVAITLG